MSQLVQLYDGILRSMGLRTDERGLISMVIEGESFPCTVGGKRLVLPTQEVLRASRWSEWVAFHPLSENIMREPSPVLVKTRNLMSFRLTYVITELLLGMMEIAADTNKHGSLSPANLRFLQMVPDAKPATWKALADVLNKVELDGPKKLINLYLRRNANLRGTGYSRGAIITFPIVSEFQNTDGEIFGVKLNKTDRQTIIALFNWLLPNAETHESYSAGSSSMVAPTFDALVRGYVNVARALNKVTESFKGELTNAHELLIDLTWVDELDHIARYKELIPILDGNEGEVAIGTTDVNTKAVSSHMSQVAKDLVASQAPKPAQQPIQQQQPAPMQMQPMRAPAPIDPRKIVINDPEFKPIGTVTINQNDPTQTAPVTANNDQDWNSFLVDRQRATMPVLPVFQSVGGQPMHPSMMQPQMQQMMPMQMPQPMMMQQQPQMVQLPNGMVVPMNQPPMQTMPQMNMNPMYAPQPQMVQLPNGMIVPMNPQQQMMMQPQPQVQLPVFQSR